MAQLRNLSRLIGLRGVKADIESLDGTLEEQAISFATDTGEIGIYTGSAWEWIGGGGSGSGGSAILMQDGVTNPPVPIENEDGNDWLYEG